MFSKRAKFWLTFLILLSLSIFMLGACGKKGGDEADLDDEGGDDATAGVPYKPPANLGSITGAVALNGSAPAPQSIDMSADTACQSKNPNAVAETVVAKDGKLQNAFVYIKDGSVTGGNRISGYTFQPSGEAVVLDQIGCQYHPHVVGIQVNQKFQVKNSDPTAHNINVQPKQGNPSWNVSQAPSTPPIEKTFARAETIIPVKCNQHPWMKAYVNVLKHPFFTISAADGSFTIKDVPPGKYTVVAWHEKFGEQTMEVTVPASGAGTANFSFDSSKTVAELTSGYMEILPALELPMLMGMEH
jgi:hypothetical protein